MRGIGHVLALMTPWDEPALRLKMVASKSVCLYNLLIKSNMYVCRLCISIYIYYMHLCIYIYTFMYILNKYIYIVAGAWTGAKDLGYLYKIHS